MKRYELVCPNNRAEAKKLFEAGEGRVSSWEVLQNLVQLLKEKGEVNAVFVRKQGETVPIELDLEMIETAIASNLEMRPTEEN